MGKLEKPTKKCKVCGNTDMSESPGEKIMGASKFCSNKCYSEHVWKKPFKALQDKGPPVKIPIVAEQASKPVKVIKDKPDRDRNYLAFVAGLGCMICNKPACAHHVYEGGMGTKCSDYWTVNLCDEHHTAASDSVHRLGTEEFEKTHGVSIENQMRKLLRQYILLLKNKYEARRNT